MKIFVIQSESENMNPSAEPLSPLLATVSRFPTTTLTKYATIILILCDKFHSPDTMAEQQLNKKSLVLIAHKSYRSDIVSFIGGHCTQNDYNKNKIMVIANRCNYRGEFETVEWKQLTKFNDIVNNESVINYYY